jgi:hypothetical protein
MMVNRTVSNGGSTEKVHLLGVRCELTLLMEFRNEFSRRLERGTCHMLALVWKFVDSVCISTYMRPILVAT